MQTKQNKKIQRKIKLKKKERERRKNNKKRNNVVTNYDEIDFSKIKLGPIEQYDKTFKSKITYDGLPFVIKTPPILNSHFKWKPLEKSSLDHFIEYKKNEEGKIVTESDNFNENKQSYKMLFNTDDENHNDFIKYMEEFENAIKNQTYFNANE